MIEIPRHPGYNKNYAKGSVDAYPCVVCGRVCKTPRWYTRLYLGNTAVTDAEMEEIIADEGDGGDLGYYPIGSDCLKQHPELQHYALPATNSRDRLIKQYEQIIHEEVFSNDEKGISIPVLFSMIRVLKEGVSAEDLEYDRDCNMQHMDQAYFRKIRWAWDKAIRATKKDLEKAVMA